MSQMITAILENGVLRLEQPCGLANGTRVRVTVEPIENGKLLEDAEWDEFERLSEEMSVDFGGQRMTRDQLHERS